MNKIVIMHVFPITGTIISVLFLGFDFLYIRPRLKNKQSRVGVRLFSIVSICILVMVVHYILEKVADIV